MKKYIIIIIAGLTFSTVKAQETTPEDALRYAVENLTGSARFRGMSGSFGAVGGDLSSINQNPAGSIFFNNNYATFTGSSYNAKNISRYYGTTTKDNDNSLDLNQAGVAFVFVDNNPKNDWKKFTVAFNYENDNNFNNSLYSAGTNPYNSIDKYFLRFANGLPQEGGITLGTLRNAYFEDLNFIDQQAYLGYNAYIFNPVSDDDLNSVYVSNVPTNGNYFQDNYTITSGYDGKFTGNFATAYKDILFLGINLNYHYTDIIKNSSVYESYDTVDSTTGLQSVQFDTETHTFGSGFSFNLGAIVKATKSLRLGVAYESPTWYRLQDEQRQAVFADCPDCGGGIFNPNITMIYDPYTVQTPSKWTGSIAYIFGKKGLLSADVSTKNYSNTSFRPKNYYTGINSYLSSALDNAIQVRLGGEYKYKQMSFRGGYRFDQSPYKVDQTFGDLTGYSGGLGYTFGDSRIDVAYSYDHRNFNYSFLSSGMTDPARVSRYNNNVTISYSMDF
ncbi:outer membrane protein transport protein [Flavobacterium paronense]|uniref:OmpP1/FadL family transporter n=1 Tax=Flavobacterium paronense TaxID=1392775 RepID=A0ABV5GAZ5_9FLAO|nr:outer membrane protein transport protein [Flavobacterium paronense]MDN3676795.1 outer membrane protein transport protein [Flavobacterium paronense]